MSVTPFDFKDYRSYLKSALPTRGEGRGARSKLSEKLGVQKSFLSAVLRGSAELSLEQAIRISRHLEHSLEERKLFLLLVEKSRAGSEELRAHFSAEITEVLQQRQDIRERVRASEALNESDHVFYYSSWHASALHMCLRVPKLQTLDGLSRYLGVPVPVLERTLEFFLRSGLARQEGGRFQGGPARIHLSTDSPMLAKHHTNWRMQAIQSLDRQRPDDLHYSSVMSISKEAFEKIRE